nr:purple acid phosphatase 15 [Tanacetum cinerariifolium]
QLYLCVDLQSYTSDIIHHVQLKGLSSDTIYYYQYGDPSIKAMSDVFTFKTMPISGPKSYPKIGTVGDLGLAHNTTSTALVRIVILVRLIILLLMRPINCIRIIEEGICRD